MWRHITIVAIKYEIILLNIKQRLTCFQVGPHGIAELFNTSRPFGGVGFLWHRSLNGCVEIVNRDPEGRCCALVLKLRNRTILFINLYLPCFDGSINYKSEILFMVVMLVIF